MFECKHDLVSIVMPAFNKERYIEESIRSVMGQTYPHWELWIVDDVSTDHTLRIAKKLAAEDARIRIVPLSENSGVAVARNAGIASAAGQYIAFLDADDLWMPEKLELQVDFMKRNHCAFSYASYDRFGEGIASSKIITAPLSTNYEQLLRGNCLGCLTVMIDREQIPDISMQKMSHEDYVAWLQILKKGYTALGIQRTLARYRVADESLSSSKWLCATWTWNIYRRIEGLSLQKSIQCFARYAMKAMWVRLYQRL